MSKLTLLPKHSFYKNVGYSLVYNILTLKWFPLFNFQLFSHNVNRKSKFYNFGWVILRVGGEGEEEGGRSLNWGWDGLVIGKFTKSKLFIYICFWLISKADNILISKSARSDCITSQENS